MARCCSSLTLSACPVTGFCRTQKMVECYIVASLWPVKLSSPVHICTRGSRGMSLERCAFMHSANVAEIVGVLLLLFYFTFTVHLFVCGWKALYRLESNRPVLNTVDCLTSNRLIRLPGTCVSMCVFM